MTLCLAAICGSDTINAALKQQTLERLEAETYLWEGKQGRSAAGVVEHYVMWVFEYSTKREFKFETPDAYKEDYVIEGLRADDQKEFSEDTLHLRKY